MLKLWRIFGGARRTGRYPGRFACRIRPGIGWSRYVNWSQFTLTKLAPVVVVKVTYRVCVPVGTGDAVTAGVVAQVCQPPVPFTSMIANGVAVSEPILNWIVPISVPESADAT